LRIAEFKLKIEHRSRAQIRLSQSQSRLNLKKIDKRSFLAKYVWALVGCKCQWGVAAAGPKRLCLSRARYEADPAGG